jgi:hypothetical protein
MPVTLSSSNCHSVHYVNHIYTGAWPFLSHSFFLHSATIPKAKDGHPHKDFSASSNGRAWTQRLGIKDEQRKDDRWSV